MKNWIVILFIAIVGTVGAQDIESTLHEINVVRTYQGMKPVKPHILLFEAAIQQVEAMRRSGWYDHDALSEDSGVYIVYQDPKLANAYELINQVPVEWFEARRPLTAYELLLTSYTYSDVHYNRIMNPKTRYIGYYTETTPIDGVLYSAVITAEVQ